MNLFLLVAYLLGSALLLGYASKLKRELQRLLSRRAELLRKGPAIS